MKYKLIPILLLLILVIGVAAYLQRGGGTDNTVADAQPTEQQTEVTPNETPAAPSDEKSQDEAVEAPAEPVVSVTPEPPVPEAEPSAEPEVEQFANPEAEQSPAVEDTQPTNTEPEAEPSPIPEDTQNDGDVNPGDAEQAPIPEETVLTQKDYHIVLTEDLVLDIPAGTEVTPDYLNYLEAMSSAIIPSVGDFSGKTETPPVEETPVEEPESYTPYPTHTEEETQKVVNDYLDNFKTTVDMSDWDESAIKELDENIEVVKSNPPSIITNYIKDYQYGYATKEEVEFQIRTFLEQGGYGSQDITVQ